MSRSLKEPETANRPIPVVVIDGHDVARLGLRAIIADADDLELVAESADQTDGLVLLATLARSLGAVGRRLVVLVDDGIAASPGSLEALRAAGPSCAVVVTAASQDGGRLLALCASGLMGMS